MSIAFTLKGINLFKFSVVCNVTSYSFLGIFHRSAPYSEFNRTFDTSVTICNICARYVWRVSAVQASNLTKLKFLYLPVFQNEFYDRLFPDTFVFISLDNIPVPCDALIIIFTAGRASLSDIVIKIQGTCRLLGDSLKTCRCLPMFQRNCHFHQ
jgi:hypothetical protein